MEKPPVILSDWDEEKGPFIIDSIFPKMEGADIDDSPEVLITRCYISAQSIFARVEFSKINFSIPMVSIKKLAVVFFDIVEDKEVRGGKRPFILVIFIPIEVHYGIIDIMEDTVEPYLEDYKTGKIPDLSELQTEIVSLLKTGIIEKEERMPSAAPTPFKQISPDMSKKITPKRHSVAKSVQTQVKDQVQTHRALTAENLAARIKTRVISTSTPNAKSGRPSSSNNPGEIDYMALVKGRGSIRVGAWKKEEEARLRELMETGTSTRDIAKQLRRSLRDVNEKKDNLG